VVEVATFDGATRPTASATNWNGRVQTQYLANETTVTDQANKVRRSLTDGLGRLSKVYEDPAGLNFETSYFYDALGNLTQVNQGGQQRIFTYDTLSRLRTAKNPEQVNTSGVMVATTYTYDDASNLITRANPNTTQVSFTYDGLNRVKTKMLSPTETWTYTYDTGTNGKGRLVSVTKGTEGYFYDGYDAMGRLSASHQVTNAGGVDQSYAFTYSYDLAGNMTREQYPSGRVITSVFDPAARLSEVKGQKTGEPTKTYASQFLYTPHGGISQMISNDVMREAMAYNSQLQPLMIELRKTACNFVTLIRRVRLPPSFLCSYF
jgi:YD repeat-containing protein